MEWTNVVSKWRTPFGVATIVVLILVTLAHTVLLHRVPGLMGDEASEGENVYELLTSETVTVTGERSYIGPLIDYVRVPFVALFGYTALALRIPVVLFSIVGFALGLYVFIPLVGRWPALFGAALFALNPVHVSYQRIAWAITLFPFFAFLIIAIAQRTSQYRWIFVGLVAGIALANHIIFAATFAALVGVGAVWWGVRAVQKMLRGAAPSVMSHIRSSYMPAVLLAIGFWAGFGMQFGILQTFQDDQGDTGSATALVWERIDAFPSFFPLAVSGSSFIARYTGVEYSERTAWYITYSVLAAGLLAIVLLYRRPAVWLFALGLGIHFGAIMYIIDRFTLRYVVMLALGLWLLAGIGLGALIDRISGLSGKVRAGAIVTCGLVLFVWSVWSIIVPFARTGGSLNDFSLGNRTNSAQALVDTRGLVACVRGRGPLYTENIHIWNRLQFFSHTYGDIHVVPEKQKRTGVWYVDYADEEHANEDVCRDTPFFTVYRIE